MERIEHELIQGTPEWDLFRLEHDGASEAAAMLGLTKKTSRPDLLRMKATGTAKEFSAWVQENILDHGHEVEALARPIAAEIIGKKLFPVTYSFGRMSASCDGLIMSGLIAWEHKQWNEKLAASVAREELPEEHQPQCQQVMYVTGAEKLLFMVSDGTKENCVWMWVYPDPDFVELLVDGWKLFNEERANYVPVEVLPPVVAESTMALPALFIHAKGEITTNNMTEFGEATANYLAGLKKGDDLVTDQDFANAKEAAKDCREAVKALRLTKSQMLAQTVTIGEACDKIDKWEKDYQAMALALEKDVERETENRRVKIMTDASKAYTEYVASLEVEISPIKLTIAAPNFAAVMKGKKSIKGWEDAVNPALSNGKIAAAASAKDLRDKLTWKNDIAAEYGFLFSDLQQIIHKPFDDFKLLVETRIANHKAEQQRKLEAEREKIRAEEQAKAQREAAEKAEAERKEQERIAAEAKAKADREAAEKAAIEKPVETIALGTGLMPITQTVDPIQRQEPVRKAGEVVTVPPQDYGRQISGLVSQMTSNEQKLVLHFCERTLTQRQEAANV